MRPDTPAERLANVNANLLSVIPPEKLEVSISATVELVPEASLEVVKDSYSKALLSYLKDAPDDKEIKYTKITALLSAIDGVNDYANLKLNNAEANIPVSVTQIPILKTVSLISGEVT